MDVRRGLGRLSGPGAPRSSRCGAAPPRPGLGRLRLPEAPSDVRSRSSTTPRCKRWAATRAARCSFSAWEPAWARPSSSTASWSRWSWATCRTAMARSRSTSECTAFRFTGSRNGGSDVEDVVRRLIAALEPEDVVLGGGNVHQLDACRRLPGRRQRQRVPRRGPTVAASAHQASRCTAIRGITRLEIEE